MILSLVYKDLLQAVKDKKGMMLSFLLPILLIALFAMVYGSFGNTTEDKAQDLVFCDEDSTALSQKLKEELNAEKGLRLLYRNKEEGKKLVLDGKVTSMLLVGTGFADSIASGGGAPIEYFYDESKEMEMGLTQGALLSVLMPFLGEQSGKGQVHAFIDEKYANELPQEIIDEIHTDIDSEFSTDNETNTANNTTLKSTALSVKENMPWGLIQAFAGTSVMMLLFSITGMGSSLIRERDRNIKTITV